MGTHIRQILSVGPEHQGHDQRQSLVSLTWQMSEIQRQFFQGTHIWHISSYISRLLGFPWFSFWFVAWRITQLLGLFFRLRTSPLHWAHAPMVPFSHGSLAVTDERPQDFKKSGYEPSLWTTTINSCKWLNIITTTYNLPLLVNHV